MELGGMEEEVKNEVKNIPNLIEDQKMFNNETILAAGKSG